VNDADNPRFHQVHFGIDEDGHDSQRRMLELIRDMEVDVVSLLTLDKSSPGSHLSLVL
jgi:hypothetical protein